MSMVIAPYRFGTVTTVDGTQGSTNAGILAAVYFTVSGTTVTVVGQKNVASVTRNTTGKYRVSFSSALANTNYGLIAGARFNDAAGNTVARIGPGRNTSSGWNTYSTTDVDLYVANNNGTLFDPVLVAVIIFDPQAVGSDYLAAASWTVSGTTVTLQRQTNVSSMSRHAAGVYRVNFNSALADNDYSIFGASRYADFTNNDFPNMGASRNTTLPAAAYSTTQLDLVTGLLHGSTSIFEAARGSLLVKDGASIPRGTVGSAQITYTGGVVTIEDSWNIASVVRDDTGLFTVTFSSPIDTIDYGLVAMGRIADSTNYDVLSIGLNRNSTTGATLHSTTQASIFAQNSLGNATDPLYMSLWFVKPWLM